VICTSHFPSFDLPSSVLTTLPPAISITLPPFPVTFHPHTLSVSCSDFSGGAGRGGRGHQDGRGRTASRPRGVRQGKGAVRRHRHPDQQRGHDRHAEAAHQAGLGMWEPRQRGQPDRLLQTARRSLAYRSSGSGAGSCHVLGGGGRWAASVRAATTDQGRVLGLAKTAAAGGRPARHPRHNAIVPWIISPRRVDRWPTRTPFYARFRTGRVQSGSESPPSDIAATIELPVQRGGGYITGRR